MTDLLDKAIADYRKIRSSSLAQTGKYRLADCHFHKASIAAERIAFNRHIAARLEAISKADLGRVSTTLSDIAKQYSQVDEQTNTAVMDTYDQAIDKYRAVGKEVMSSHALALYGKMIFAEQLGDYDKADAALDAARNLLGEIAKSDPVFFKSITARLVSESTDYIPPMPVNYAAQYEEFKKRFQGWKRLLRDEKKVEVERLLAMLDNMPQPLDPDAFKRIIEPERQALQAQMAKGFDEVEIDIDLSDPNYF
jgi:tetratricopeptide (TPR) repeat protein